MKVDRSMLPESALPSEPGRVATFALGRLSHEHLLVGILLLATLLRIASAILHGNGVDGLPGVYDQISYDGLARRVLDGYGFSFAQEWWPITRAGAPTAHWSYLYTLYVTVVYTLFGAQPLVARLLQAVIAGLLHSWLVWRIGRRIFSPTVGLVAAAITAVYAYFVYYAGALLTEPFYFIGILWTFDVALRLAAVERKPAGNGQRHSAPPRWWRWVELGVAIGITALLRQLFLLFVPFLFFWLWWNRPARPATASPRPQLATRVNWPVLQGLVLATVVIILLIAPWTVRNYRAFGTFTPLNTNAGYAFFWGNHPIYGTHFVGILPREGPSYQDLIPAELRHLNEAALDQALLKVGIGFIVADPMRYARLSLSRTREYFKFWPSAESSRLSNLARVGSFGLFLPFMLYGLWTAGRHAWLAENHYQRAAICLLLLFMAIYTAIHLLTWALIRYRLPVDAILLIFAAVGLVQIAEKLRRH
jgi:hypothetical protein